MRVNIYAEEMTDRVELVEKVVDGETFTGVRFYLYLPMTVGAPLGTEVTPLPSMRGPFIHRIGDDDSASVTFWGKAELTKALQKALGLLANNRFGTPTK